MLQSDSKDFVFFDEPYNENHNVADTQYVRGHHGQDWQHHTQEWQTGGQLGISFWIEENRRLPTLYD